MSDSMEIILAFAALISPVASAFGANALTKHRLDRLELKVDAHNNFDSRIARCEESAKLAHHRIDEAKGWRSE